jgi:phosphoglycerate dehydrogenase-like enzyme
MLKLVLMPPLDDRRRNWLPRLRESLPDFEVVAPETESDAKQEVSDADAAYGVVPLDALKTSNKLLWIQSAQAAPPAGYYYMELIDHPVVVCNPRGVFSDHIGQHIMMYVLGLARGLPYFTDAQRNRRWDKAARKHKPVDLSEATVLIVGVGGIGSEAARLCSAFGMSVIGVDGRWEQDPPDYVERHEPDELDSLLPSTDFVIVTTPHTPQTEGMWHKVRFGLMKPTSYFINIGRGMTTRIDDLAEAVETGVIAGCGLDVYEVEPLPEDHKLWTLENAILTPHIAIQDADNVSDRMFDLLVANARRFAKGEDLENVVDKSMWF